MFSLLHLRGRVCDWREWDAIFEQARSLIQQGITGGMGPIFALAYPLSAEELCTVTKVVHSTPSLVKNASLHWGLVLGVQDWSKARLS